MDSFSRLRSSVQVWNRGRFLGALVVIAALVSVPGLAAIAQALPSQPSDNITVQGRVIDSSGRRIGGASVLLEQSSAALKTTTNPEGVFVFSSLQSGTYALSAEKSGLRSRISSLSLVSGKAPQSFDLILDIPAAAHSDSVSSPPSSPETMTFSDKPDFTIAGIIDSTAAGGHGSDMSLRTSEALARETATLKPDNAGAGATASGAAEAAQQTEMKLRVALARSPDSFAANRQLGEFCFHEGSYRQALPPLQAAYRIDPSNRANAYDLAVAYKETGDLSQAREHLQNLLAHEDDPNLHRLLGDVDEKAGDPLAAVHEYEQAVRLDPSEQNYFSWGSELLLHRAVQPAAEVLENGAQAHPGSARILAALGAALFAGGQYDKAALRLCDASGLNSADPAPYIFLGKIDMAAPEPLPCVQPKLQQFLQRQPENARANFYFAMAVWRRQRVSEDPGDLQHVESLLEKAVTLDPGYDEAWLQLGILYSIEHDFGKAIASYAKAIEVNPQLSEAHYRLGVAYERTGERTKARQEFQLHDKIEKQQAAAVERQRRETKQFTVVLEQQQSRPSAN